MLRFFSELRIMVKGITVSIKPLVWALLLLTIIMFMFAVVIMQLVLDELESTDRLDEHIQEDILSNFGSMYSTMFNLFMATSGGFDWKEAALLLEEIHPGVALIFALYIAFTVFCFLNIVTAFFVETAGKICLLDEDHVFLNELEQHDIWVAKIKKVFFTADTDGSGVITREEFQSAATDPSLPLYFKYLGIDLQIVSPRQL